jgi:hypothetical protein
LLLKSPENPKTLNLAIGRGRGRAGGGACGGEQKGEDGEEEEERVLRKRVLRKGPIEGLSPTEPFLT